MNQSLHAEGGAIAVQIAGDGNTVLIGGEAFAHSLLHKRQAEPRALIDLLRTDVRATTFVGRAGDLALLADWLALPDRVAIRCVIGGAGAGKTRLAIEACEAAEAQGWFATFAPSQELARFHAMHNLVRWKQPRDMLIVVDYAATSAAVLKSWFTALASQREADEGHRLRILLLERHANADMGWWSELQRRDSIDHAVAADLIGDEVPHALQPLDAVRDRRALLAEVMAKAAKLLKRPALLPPEPGVDRAFDERLADNRRDNEPLYLAMAGIHAADNGAPAALAMGRLDLAEIIAGIEMGRLDKLSAARGFADPAVLRHLVACVTLQNGCEPTALLALVREELEAQGLAAPFAVQAIAEVLCDFLPRTQKVEPVRPDLIGETLMRVIVGGGPMRSDAECRAIVLRAWHREPAGTVETLMRAAADLAEGRGDHAIVGWLRAVIEACADYDSLASIADSLPEQTLALRELASEIAGRLAALLRPLAKERDAFTPALAGALNNFANRLSDLGCREEALAAAEEAEALYRTLASNRPDAFMPDLAMALNNLANRFSDVGRREEALAAAEEASALYRKLAADRPDAFTPDLAMVLNTHANRLSALGSREEALAAAEEAVALYRALVADRPDGFTPELAAGLNNLANRLSALGRREEALAAAEEAVALRRKLVADRPDAFIPNLAGSLNNLAILLSDLGRREEALAAAKEAVALRRKLAADRPDVFTPNLAMALNTLANSLSDLGRCEEALATAKEASALYRKLAADRPDAFTPDLAMALNTLANRLSDLGHREEALDAAAEAVALRRTLAADRPDAFTPELASSLNNLSTFLSALGRREEALAAAAEAVVLRRKLATDRPDVFAPNLALSLSVLGDMMEAVERLAEAVACDHEAVSAIAPYCLAAPAVFGGRTMTLLRDYLRRAKAAGAEIDADLVEQLIAHLTKCGLIEGEE